MVELSNGCICCAARGLLTSLSSLASENRFDHVHACRQPPARHLPPTHLPALLRAGPRRVVGHLGASPRRRDLQFRDQATAWA